jgi:hypothetical protein
MNIINKGFLGLALFPEGLYRNAGVNTTQLKSILTTKLTIDDRRPPVLQQMSGNRSKKPVKSATIRTMFLSAVMGLLYLLAFSVGSNAASHLTFYFTMFFVMLSASLISDFTSVLIDVRDNYIILPKPVTDRTFIVARLLHIFIHICKLVLPMALPGVILVGVLYGIGAALLFQVIILLLTVFTIFFINAVYILILRVTTPQKFQTIISFVQIIFAISIYAGYQIFPRMIDEMNLDKVDFTTRSWMIFYPLYWFASLWNVLVFFEGSEKEWIAAALGLLLPFGSLYIVVKYLAPSFNNKLAMIAASSSETEVKQKVKKVAGKKSYPDLLSRIFTRSHTEKMGFLFTWKMTGRSRDFWLKVYPSIGYLVVYVFIMFFRGKEFTVESIRQESGRGRFAIISALYFSSLVLIMAINQIIYSEKHKAAWIYYVMPIRNPGEVILGGTKAAILKFYIPMVVFITIIGVYLVGFRILPNILLGLFNELLIVTLMVYMGRKMFPFSVHQNTNIKSGSFLRSMFVLMVSGLIAAGHFFVYTFTPVVIIFTLMSITATWMMMGSIRNTSWASVNATYSDQ